MSENNSTGAGNSVDQISIGHWEVDARTNDLFWSDEVFLIHGLELDGEVNLDAAINSYHPDDREKVREHLRRALEEKQNFLFDLRLVRPDGEIRRVRSTGVVRTDADGIVVSVFGVFQDITNQMRMEHEYHDLHDELDRRVVARTQALTLSEARLKQTESLAKVGYWVWNEIEDRAISCSDECARIHGVSPEEYVKITCSIEQDDKWVHPDDQDEWKKANQHLEQSLEQYDIKHRLITRQGETRWVREIAEPELDENGVHTRTHGIIQDITETHLIEETLRDSESRFKAITEITPAAIFMTQISNGEILYANPTGEKLFRCTAVDLVGRLAADFYANPDHRELLKQDMKTDAGRSSEEVHFKRPDGTTFWALNSAQVLPDGERMMSILVDITDRKRIEAEMLTNEHRFRALYHQSPLGITVYDYSRVKPRIDRLHAQGIVDFQTYFEDNPEFFQACMENIRLTDANDTQVRMFGCKTIKEYMDWEDARVLEADEDWWNTDHQELASLANGDVTFVAEVSDQQIDGTPLNIRMISRVSDNALDDWSEIISTYEDITERRKLERIKSEFISTISHELRTPLTSIKGSLGLVVGGTLGELPDMASSMVDLAFKNTNRLIGLVNDVLDIEKIAAGAIEYDFQPLNLSELVTDAIGAEQGFLAAYGGRRIIMDITPSAMVSGDAKRLNQVVANLLSNAVKFSPQDGEITISVGTHDHQVAVSFADQGEGIPTAFRAQIFQRFAQVDNSDSRQTGGTGLGLNISKSIIEAHDGLIDFRSEQDAGSTFFFTLPALA